MNKQALATLTIQQLRQHKQTLAKRIDDLKFFNLDLGRENIRLAEQYKVHREHAQKIKQGKATRIRRAKHFTKNIYLQNQGQSYSHIQRVQKVKKQSNKQTISSGGLKLNDLYKVGKSKLTGWWGSSNNEKSLKQQKNKDLNVNERMGNNNYYHGQQYNVDKNSTIQQVYQIIIDCPPVQVMRQPQNLLKDPMLQQISQIIRQQHRDKKDQPQQFTQYQQGNKQLSRQSYKPYQRLYNKQLDDQRYIYQQQRVYHYDNHHGINQQQKIQKQQKKQQNKKQHPNRKNFEFDDLPGMGWRKLKGLVGFGSSSSKKNKSKQTGGEINDINDINVNVNNGQYQYQHQQQQYYIQEQQQQHYQQNQQSNQQQHQQRKRIPIFSPLYSNTSEITTQQQNEYKVQIQQQQKQHQNQHITQNNNNNNQKNDNNLANQMIQTKNQQKL